MFKVISKDMSVTSWRGSTVFINNFELIFFPKKPFSLKVH